MSTDSDETNCADTNRRCASFAGHAVGIVVDIIDCR
jgi:hypothetical protein